MSEDPAQLLCQPRRQILNLCFRQEMRASDLAKIMGVSRVAVNKHTKILSDSGLLQVEKRRGHAGPNHWYRTDLAAVTQLTSSLVGEISR